VIQAACPVCGSDRTTDLGPPLYRRPPVVAGVPIELSDLDLSWRRCGRCEFQFIYPGVPQERLLRCYTAAGEGHWGTGESHADARSYPHKKQVLARLSPGKRVLDFGCFDGGFLAYLGDEYDKLGIEPAVGPARIAAQRGVRIVAPTIDSVDPKSIAPVDAIVSFDVFEHLIDPVAALRGLTRLLRPGGVIIIGTGNTDEPQWRRLGTRHPYSALVEHVSLWNRSSLNEAAQRAGLEMESFEVSAHHHLQLKHHIEYAAYNLAWNVLRLLRVLRIPLPKRLTDAARGPMPRARRADHLLAVLRLRASRTSPLTC
jgi:SAM-dependent methyltransferase